MDVFAEYLAKIDHPGHRVTVEEVLAWVIQEFPL